VDERLDRYKPPGLPKKLMLALKLAVCAFGVAGSVGWNWVLKEAVGIPTMAHVMLSACVYSIVEPRELFWISVTFCEDIRADRDGLLAAVGGYCEPKIVPRLFVLGNSLPNMLTEAFCVCEEPRTPGVGLGGSGIS
jgi:hypothetical protein